MAGIEFLCSEACSLFAVICTAASISANMDIVCGFHVTFCGNVCQLGFDGRRVRQQALIIYYAKKLSDWRLRLPRNRFASKHAFRVHFTFYMRFTRLRGLKYLLVSFTLKGHNNNVALAWTEIPGLLYPCVRGSALCQSPSVVPTFLSSCRIKLRVCVLLCSYLTRQFKPGRN